MRAPPHPDLARVAAAIGERTRAAMLAELLGGEALPAGELARRASVAPPTASAHLARLVESGLVTRRTSGRHRYFALAGPDVAAALEALQRLAANPSAAAARAPRNGTIEFARTCYDHLAGRLGVLVTESMIVRELITASRFEVTASGEEWLRVFGVNLSALRQSRRPLARPCLDWSERRDHLAGAVGAALVSSMLERRWLQRLEGTRALRLTLRGREGLYRSLAIGLDGQS